MRPVVLPLRPLWALRSRMPCLKSRSAPGACTVRLFLEEGPRKELRKWEEKGGVAVAEL